MSSDGPDPDSVRELVRRINESVAVAQYRRFGDTSKLKALGLSPELLNIKRPRGRRNALAMKPEYVVQLVWKAKLVAGISFSNNVKGIENPCFEYVAGTQGVGVATVKRAWKQVPAQERREIHDWLRDLLRKHNALHPRHR